MFKSSLVGGLILLSGALILTGCAEDDSAEANAAVEKEITAKSDDKFQTIEWTDLMPKDDLEAFMNPPESLDEIEDGSPEDEISSQIQSAIAQTGDSRYQQALVSTRVVPEFDGKDIRLPGFIVPLEFGEEKQVVTRFFLVPYFGACIHVPPPPPNQLVYAEFDRGIKLESLNDPYWLSGKLSTTLTENDVATAAYAVKVDKLELYEWP